MRAAKKTESGVQPKSIKVVKEFRIPGTNIIAEEGDELLVYPPEVTVPVVDPVVDPLVDPLVAEEDDDPEDGLTPDEIKAACENYKRARKAKK